MKRPILLGTALVAALALAGCGSSGDAGGKEKPAAAKGAKADDDHTRKPNPWASDAPGDDAPKPKVAAVKKGKKDEKPAKNPWALDASPGTVPDAG